MPRHDDISPQDVLAFLSAANEPASARQIARALELRHAARRQLQKILSQLKRRKEVEEISTGKFALAGKRKSYASQPDARAASAGKSQPAARSPATADPNSITGRIVMHRDGYGFVVPDKPVRGMDGDLFIGRDNTGDAMHGDSVQARIERRRPDGRAEGRILKVLKRVHPTVVGLFPYNPRGTVVVPFETRLGQEIVIPPGAELPGATPAPEGHAKRSSRRPELDGAVVDVELTRYPRGGVPAAGRVVEIVGRTGEMGVDIEIVVRKHHLPNKFPEEVRAAGRAAPQRVAEADLRGREDFRRLPIVTIDGETAKDFDDAVHVRRLPGNHYELQVHIADVAHYVTRGSALDREARLRGTSVYFPDRAIPMLPEDLSNGICSLNPQVDRLVMSAVMELDSSGAVLHARFTAGVIHSAERMTYTNVNKVLEGDAEMSARYAAQVEHFHLMRELALILNARRNGRGSIDFDLPEPFIEFDELGRMVKIIRSERNIAHRIIEEFMLAANEAVASYLEKRAIASLHRVHEKPDPKKVLEFEELAHAFGYSLGVENLAERQVVVKHGHSAGRARPGFGHGRGAGRGGGRERQMTYTMPADVELDIRPQHYQRLTRKIAGKPEERIVSYLMLRSLKQARYAAEPLGHFALAAAEYTHFTSPIRRYPDLIVHRILKWALENPIEQAPLPARSSSKQRLATQPPHRGPYSPTELEEVAAESSESERRADAAERELMDWKTAEFMEQHLGEEYNAIIISVLKFGFFVELMEIFVEGLVPIGAIEEFTGARCMFRERERSIVAERPQPTRGGRSRGAVTPAGQRTAFRLGDRLRVRAERIDPIMKRVEFALVAHGE